MTPPVERRDDTTYDPVRFRHDLRAAAESIRAPFDPDVVQQTLDVFDDEFHRCVVQLKATCQPDTGVYYRFFYKWERDLTALAQAHGMIPQVSSPIVDLQQQVLENCPGARRPGSWELVMRLSNG